MDAEPSTIKDRIRDDILAGRIPFGSRLRIDELAHRYAVSHTPVREALRELRGEGVVTIERHRGARARTLDAPFIERIFAIRAALEPLLVRQAVARMTSADIEDLEADQAALEAEIDQHAYDAVLLRNRDWHRRIYALAANPEALAVIDQHWLFLAAVWRRIGHPRERFPTMIADHRAILQAVERRDGEDAAILTAAHVVRAKLLLLQHLARLAPD
jgi:DNA-binding GntR family transcriptional regulator